MDSDDIMWGIIAADEARIKDKNYLRIEFAKAALAGMLHSVAYIEADVFANTIAKRAFDIADAMVERMNK